MDHDDESQYLVFSDRTVLLGDDPYFVRVHWALVEGRVQAVGVDLRTFTSGDSVGLQKALEVDATPLLDPWHAIKATTLRALPWGQIVEESHDMLQEQLREALAQSAERRAERQEVLGAFEDKPRRGPTPALSVKDLREVVVPAYVEAAKAPRVAVQIALEESGVIAGSGPNGEVTRAQAKAAVDSARAKGLLPKGKKK